MGRVTRTCVFAMAMTLGLGLWVTAIWARFRYQVPIWALVGFAAVLVLGLRCLHVWTTRAPETPDELAPWRGQRCIRDLRLVANDLQDHSLTMNLVEESDPTTTVATLRFDGVVGLRLQQLGDWALPFDGLRCRDLGVRRRDGIRFRVCDVWDNGIEFHCRTFAAIPPTRSPGMGPDPSGG